MALLDIQEKNPVSRLASTTFKTIHVHLFFNLKFFIESKTGLDNIKQPFTTSVD
jgi:hypothetical protein